MLLRLMSFWILLGSTTHFPSLKRKLHPICYVHLLTKEEFFFFYQYVLFYMLNLIFVWIKSMDRANEFLTLYCFCSMSHMILLLQ
jgi:hypothetical protein